MESGSRFYALLYVLCCVCSVSVRGASHRPTQFGRKSFPSDFVFGLGSASYQYEGAAKEDGRGISIWDTFSHTPGKIVDGSDGDVANDQYHRYKEDVKLLVDLGVDSYRFSIAWPRIFPKGRGIVNKKGILYYSNLIDELLKNGIEPFVTIFHWDLPQTLQDEYGGFLSNKIVNDFVAYADICFQAFGDRVKKWVTINELLIIAMAGYNNGNHAPGRCSTSVGNCSAGDSATEPYIVGHHLLLSHAATVKLYRAKYQIGTLDGFRVGVQRLNIPSFSKSPVFLNRGVLSVLNPPSESPTFFLADAGYDVCIGNARTTSFSYGHEYLIEKKKQEGSIGVTLVSHWFIPYTNDLTNQKAARRILDFYFGWYMDPLTRGEYPTSMRNLVGSRLPRFTKEESKLVQGSFDFIGINYYTTMYAINNNPPPNVMPIDFNFDSRANLTSVKNGVLIGPQAGSSWLHVYPRGIGALLNFIKNRYNNPPVYITENGIDETNNASMALKESLNDTWRIDYHSKHLLNLLLAIRDGCNVLGYYGWSFTDDFEWDGGYSVRFGFYFIDYNRNLTRYPKASSYWFKNFLSH